MYFTTNKITYNIKVINPRELYVPAVANRTFDSSPYDENEMTNT